MFWFWLRCLSVNFHLNRFKKNILWSKNSKCCSSRTVFLPPWARLHLYYYNSHLFKRHAAVVYVPIITYTGPACTLLNIVIIAHASLLLLLLWSNAVSRHKNWHWGRGMQYYGRCLSVCSKNRFVVTCDERNKWFHKSIFVKRRIVLWRFYVEYACTVVFRVGTAMMMCFSLAVRVVSARRMISNQRSHAKTITREREFYK